jgi:hypothetical protein
MLFVGKHLKGTQKSRHNHAFSSSEVFSTFSNFDAELLFARLVPISMQ